ncbi:RNA-binding protein [Fulvivirgaceae bacterium BMA12]|uniref:RNA-binding protein n=1 Tax=Agaribacillus aureus TaxID=3051825 RepID=A0ABT8L984_9BACT|nr:RNA-binding protein [Fulvivirgaceae bacterium BMA12]
MNIFVANLDFNFKSEGLKELFEEYGEVSSAKIIMDFGTGKSKGFGFVEMPDDNEAQLAINSLNEHEINGRPIVVKEAKPRS